MILLLCYILLCVASEGAQIAMRARGLTAEREKVLSRIWHAADAVIRTGVFYALTRDVVETLYWLAVYWLVFDKGLNAVLKKRILYVGKTSWMDVRLRWLAMKLKLRAELVAIVLQLIVLAGCAGLYYTLR